MTRDHYYSVRPGSPSRPREVRATLRGMPFRFLTDSGVFSKGGVDYGTRLLAEQMEIPQGAAVLDMGCGYGVLGLVAAAWEPSSQVLLVDINERAVELAQKNAQLNQLDNVRVIQSDGFANIGGQQFDVILMNPPIRAGKKVLHQLYQDAYQALRAGGRCWLVVGKKQGAPSTLRFWQELAGAEQVEEVARSKGYYVIAASRRGEHGKD